MPTDFYRYAKLETGDGMAVFAVSYNENHEIFSGHFPEQPVVPGVCTMAMIKDLLEMATGKKLILKTASNVKFLRLILPDLTPTVNINWKETEAGYDVTASLKEGDNFLFKMNGVFGNFE